MCIDNCTDICAGIFLETCIDIGPNIRIDMCIDICIDIGIDTRIDTCIDICIDSFIGTGIGTCINITTRDCLKTNLAHLALQPSKTTCCVLTPSRMCSRQMWMPRKFAMTEEFLHT